MNCDKTKNDLRMTLKFTLQKTIMFVFYFENKNILKINIINKTSDFSVYLNYCNVITIFLILKKKELYE